MIRMKLYFVRHATPSETAASDFAKTLTPLGEDEARIVGAALLKFGVRPAHILTSRLVRARQTAEIIGRTLDCQSEIKPIDELKNGASTQALLRVLDPYAEAAEIVLVGHMPSLAEHIGAMTGANSPKEFPLGKGSVVSVEMEKLAIGSGRLLSVLHQSDLIRLVA